MSASPGEQDTTGRLSVLLVDDEGVYISLLAEQLRADYGFETAVAYSGIEAITTLRSQKHFDVIVLDYKMPDIDGLGVLRWLYEQKNETPVIVLTAAGSEEVVAEAMKLGAYDYLRKEQLELSELARCIRATHERYRMAKEKEQIERTGGTNPTARITDALVSSVENIVRKILTDLETRTDELARQLPPDAGRKLQEMSTTVKDQVAQLNTTVADLLRLSSAIVSRQPPAAPSSQQPVKNESKPDDSVTVSREGRSP